MAPGGLSPLTCTGFRREKDPLTLTHTHTRYTPTMHVHSTGACTWPCFPGPHLNRGPWSRHSKQPKRGCSAGASPCAVSSFSWLWSRVAQPPWTRPGLHPLLPHPQPAPAPAPQPHPWAAKAPPQPLPLPPPPPARPPPRPLLPPCRACGWPPSQACCPAAPSGPSLLPPRPERVRLQPHSARRQPIHLLLLLLLAPGFQAGRQHHCLVLPGPHSPGAAPPAARRHVPAPPPGQPAPPPPPQTLPPSPPLYPPVAAGPARPQSAPWQEQAGLQALRPHPTLPPGQPSPPQTAWLPPAEAQCAAACWQQQGQSWRLPGPHALQPHSPLGPPAPAPLAPVRTWPPPLPPGLLLTKCGAPQARAE